VNADMRILDGKVSVDTSCLTGESMLMDRTPEIGDKRFPMESKNSVFSGTYCMEGKATCCVVEIGNNTFIGKISY